MRWPLSIALVAACVPDTPANPPRDEWNDKLAERVVDYNAALRIAALRLTGELPTLAEIEAVQNASDPAVAYGGQVHAYLASPAFTRQMVVFWRDTLKLGGTPVLDTAPVFLAQLVVMDRPFLAAFTATGGTCPTYDGTQITPADCTNGGDTVGILTNPGVNAQFFSNFAFRRVRWLQEVFECSRFPAEIAEVGQDVGGATPYTGTFPFDSIGGGRVDFLQKDSVICANCHSNLNHIAPLFAHYDSAGTYQPTIAVPTPLPNAPLAQLSDYLPPGEPLAWRHGKIITDMRSLGAAVAGDPETSRCAVSRLWNWAMGKGDIVDASAKLPVDTIATQVDAFTADNYRIRGALERIFNSDDFVRF